MLYTLKTRQECEAFEPRYAPNGSFCEIGGRGIDNWVRLGSAERLFTFAQAENWKLQNWAIESNGSGVKLYYDETADSIDWGIVLMSSALPLTQYKRQKVNVLKFSPDGAWALIDAIPYQANGDYSAFTPDKHPEFWLEAYTCFTNNTYGPSHTFPDGTTATFLMPLFDPTSGFKVSSSAKSIGGLWVDTRILYEMEVNVKLTTTQDLKMRSTPVYDTTNANSLGRLPAGSVIYVSDIKVDTEHSVMYGFDANLGAYVALSPYYEK